MQSNNVDISTIICSYNRCESLKKTLASLMNQEIPEDLSYEVLIVDNNSSDRTKEAVEKFKAKYPGVFRYIFEKNQGVSFARNAGIKEAKGEIIAFIDDDVLVDTHWLANIVRAFKKYNVVCIGGKAKLTINEHLPKWLHDKLKGPFGKFDKGDEIIITGKHYNVMCGIGANMSFRKSVFDKYGLFRTDLGRIGNKLLMGEETELVNRIKEGGDTCMYYPSAIVNHRVDKNKLNKNYLRRWYFRIGGWSYYGENNSDLKCMKIFNVPRWKFRIAIRSFLEMIFFAFIGRYKESFKSQLYLISFLGYLVEANKTDKTYGQ